MIETIYSNPDCLMHYGVKGMKWGVRNYQRADGTLTTAGLKYMQKQIENGLPKVNAKNSKSSKLIREMNDEFHKTKEYEALTVFEREFADYIVFSKDGTPTGYNRPSWMSDEEYSSFVTMHKLVHLGARQKQGEIYTEKYRSKMVKAMMDDLNAADEKPIELVVAGLLDDNLLYY